MQTFRSLCRDTGKQLDPGVGATLLYSGDGKVDQTAQGVRFKSEFDTNMALFVGGTLRYILQVAIKTYAAMPGN